MHCSLVHFEMASLLALRKEKTGILAWILLFFITVNLIKGLPKSMKAYMKGTRQNDDSFHSFRGSKRKENSVIGK